MINDIKAEDIKVDQIKATRPAAAKDLSEAIQGSVEKKSGEEVRSVHLFCPSPETAEVSIHVRQGERSRAIAARIELVAGRWCCTALQFG